jgi:hypothetical protein
MNIPGTQFCYRLISLQAALWLEGLGQLKNPVTSSGIKPATIQLVA